METLILIPLVVISLLLLIVTIFEGSSCDHKELIYYDSAGDGLEGDLSEACFSKCQKCGLINVIPTGFQSDAHFDNYLYQAEQGNSAALKKIKND